ncbi:MAG: Gfo/Idh/MocA family oxidoreductase [Bdellovibrionota bacterium]
MAAAKSQKSKSEASKRKTPKNVQKKIRYGVVGLGHIAQTAVLPAFKHASKNSVLTALVTHDPKKAKQLSAKYKVKHVYDYENFGELLTDDVVDALYICLPNNLHVDFTVEALKAGIHVLCEKPLALTEEEVAEMKAAADKGRAKLMTAYRLHFEPSNLKAIDICKSGKLGNLRHFSSDFSYLIKDPDNIRLQKAKGGGPLWDIGIYCINAARSIFQQEPIEVFAYESQGRSEKFNEVEEMVSAVLRFPNEKVATFTCSFGCASTADYKVYGTKGSLQLEKAYEYATPRKLVVKMEDGPEKVTKFSKNDQFAPEIVYFSEAILKNRVIEPGVEEGLADVRVIRALIESIEKNRSIEVEQIKSDRMRPNGKMKNVFPGISEPKQINVTSPSK